MRGKWHPKKGIHMTHNCEVYWVIFLSFSRRYSRFCVVGYRLFSRYDIYIFIIYNWFALGQKFVKWSGLISWELACPHTQHGNLKNCENENYFIFFAKTFTYDIIRFPMYFDLKIEIIVFENITWFLHLFSSLKCILL